MLTPRLFYFYCGANFSTRSCLVSTNYVDTHGLEVNINIRSAIALFSVRSLAKSNWKNSNDVYIGKQ